MNVAFCTNARVEFRQIADGSYKVKKTSKKVLTTDLCFDIIVERFREAPVKPAAKKVFQKNKKTSKKCLTNSLECGRMKVRRQEKDKRRSGIAVLEN